MALTKRKSENISEEEKSPRPNAGDRGYGTTSNNLGLLQKGRRERDSIRGGRTRAQRDKRRRPRGLFRREKGVGLKGDRHSSCRGSQEKQASEIDIINQEKPGGGMERLSGNSSFLPNHRRTKTDKLRIGRGLDVRAKRPEKLLAGKARLLSKTGTLRRNEAISAKPREGSWS